MRSACLRSAGEIAVLPPDLDGSDIRRLMAGGAEMADLEEELAEI